MGLRVADLGPVLRSLYWLEFYSGAGIRHWKSIPNIHFMSLARASLSLFCNEIFVQIQDPWRQFPLLPLLGTGVSPVPFSQRKHLSGVSAFAGSSPVMPLSLNPPPPPAQVLPLDPEEPAGVPWPQLPSLTCSPPYTLYWFLPPRGFSSSAGHEQKFYAYNLPSFPCDFFRLGELHKLTPHTAAGLKVSVYKCERGKEKRWPNAEKGEMAAATTAPWPRSSYKCKAFLQAYSL